MASPIETMVAAPMEMTVDTSEERIKKKLLFGLSMKGDWDKVVEMYEKDPWAHTAKITRSGNTALHIAVSDGKEDIVEQLVNHIRNNEESKAKALNVVNDWKNTALKVVNDRKNTALHLAAWMGSVKMSQSIAGVDSKLVGTRNVDGETPFFLAAVHGRKDAFLYLHSKCSEPNEGYTYCRRRNGETILHCAITGDYFELAYQIILQYGDLVNSVNKEGISPLHLLASKPSAFKSGSHLSWWSKIIYHCIFVDELKQEELPKTSKACNFPDCPENYHTCINFFLVLRKMIKQLWDMIRGETTKQHEDTKNPKTKYRETSKKDGDAENPKTNHQGQQSTNGTQEHQLYPSNYDALFGFIKVVSKAMLVILGLGSAEISKVQSKKQKNTWSVQIMNELLERTSMYEYEDDGKDPQQTPPLQKADEATPYTAIFSELASPDDQNKEKNIEEKGEEGEKKIPDRRKKETAILIAAKHGVAEMVDEILKLFPVAIHDMNSEKKNIVLLAVESRQPHVYQLLLEKTIFKESEFRRVDDKGNSALQLAAMQGAFRPWLIPGAALQMQWEIKWYEFVKNSMPPHFFAHYNKDGKAPKSVFTDTHKELAKSGGEWLTNTSESCSVVAALIATVAFATSSTVPGGVNQNNGLPTLEAEPAFNVFAISSLVALCFSVTAVVMFLAILTSRYQERDFGHDLPRKLLVGLSSLFVSIASMLISFCAGHFFVLKDKLQYAAFPIYAVTCLPVTLFAVAQFPLYFDLIWATFKKVPQRSYQVVSQ